jgi:hypothetical protein
VDSLLQDDIYSDQYDFDTIDDEEAQRAPIAESPVHIIESPPLDLICPPTPEVEGGQKEDDVDEGQETTPPKAVKRKKMKVFFVVILSGFSNTTFTAGEAEKLRDALMLATKDLGTLSVVEYSSLSINTNLYPATPALSSGAKYDVQVKITSITDFIIPSQRRRLLASSIKIQAEAEFDEEDESVASDLAQILTDSPSSVFPTSEFGTVDVPEVGVVEVVDTTSILLPISFGILGGLAVCGLGWLAFRRRNLGRGHHSQPSKMDSISSHPFQNMEHPSGMRTQSQTSLLPSISSKNYYTDREHNHTPGMLVNNLGAGFM